MAISNAPRLPLRGEICPASDVALIPGTRLGAYEITTEIGAGGGSSANYDVAADGRFVMIRRKNPVTPTVIDVVFNWPRALGTP